MAKTNPIRGRGTASNPANRFERIQYEPDPEHQAEQKPQTEFLRDTSRTVIASNESPDVGFDVSVNPYRGCEHGCIYCYARPFHEYLGFSAGLDFETKILVKEDAPELLRRELDSPRWKPQPLAMSGITDPYQPVERRLQLTRRCLEVLLAYRNPVIIITKNHLVTRDIDLLAQLSEYNAAAVFVSVTTLDASLARIMEPRTSTPTRRLEAIRALSKAGIPTGALVAPIIPGLTDHEIPTITNAVAKAGAKRASYIIVRLPRGVGDLFEHWLEENFPLRKKRVLSRIREMREGGLSDSRFKTRMRGTGVYADQIASLFKVACRKAGLENAPVQLSTAAFRGAGRHKQLGLFDHLAPEDRAP